MGSNETMQEELEERDKNNNFGPSDEGSNLSSLNNTEVPELKEMEIFIASDEKDAAVEEHKELADSDAKQEPLINDEEMVDVCTNEDDSLVNDNNNNTAVTQEEEIEPFSGVFCDSGVRELIESDPFLRQVVDTFLKYHDEMESDKQNGNVCANGGSTPSDVNDNEMAQEKQM